MQPSLLMRKNRVSKVASEPTYDPFPTIDEALDLSQQLQGVLKKLGEQKYPLDVRKARRREVRTMPVRKEDRESKQIRAGSRTYFIDIEKTKEGKRYLRITESRFKGEGSDRERNSIVVFPEEAKEFVRVVSEMGAKIA
ncbi:MAG: DUF3276 family protein [Aggregatilineales bacterium]